MHEDIGKTVALFSCLSSMIRGYLQEPMHNQALQSLLGQEWKDLWLRRWRHPHQCYRPELHFSLGPYSQERWNFALAERLWCLCVPIEVIGVTNSTFNSGSFEQVLMKPMLPLRSYLSWNAALHSAKNIIWKRGFASLVRKEIHVKWRLPLQESLFVQVLFKTVSENTCLQFREHFMSKTYKQPEQYNQQVLSQTHGTLL